MLLKNARIFIGKTFVAGDIEFDRTVTRIGTLDGEGIDLGGRYVIPGMVDIHTHGAIGEDFSEGSPEGLRKLSDYYVSKGVTSYLATTVTLNEAGLTPVMHAVRDTEVTGAKCAGVHLEGPFLSMAKRGAQNPAYIQSPDCDMLDRLNDASGNRVKLITVAPEEPNAMEFIAHASKTMTVSIGHTTADYDTAMRAFGAGATHLTHTFNGMESLHHRKPGVIAAGLDAGASAELICDGFHVHPAAIRFIYRAFGDKVNLITDSLACAYMADGKYRLGEMDVFVHDGKATLENGTIAGSSIALIDGLRNAVKFGFSLSDAVYAASTAPAEAVHLDAGRIRVGAPADLAVLDSELNLVSVYVDGVKKA